MIGSTIATMTNSDIDDAVLPELDTPVQDPTAQSARRSHATGEIHEHARRHWPLTQTQLGRELHTPNEATQALLHTPSITSQSSANSQSAAESAAQSVKHRREGASHFPRSNEQLGSDSAVVGDNRHSPVAHSQPPRTHAVAFPDSVPQLV